MKERKFNLIISIIVVVFILLFTIIMLKETIFTTKSNKNIKNNSYNERQFENFDKWGNNHSKKDKTNNSHIEINNNEKNSICSYKSLDCINIDNDLQAKYKDLLDSSKNNIEVEEWNDYYFEKFGFNLKLPSNWNINDSNEDITRYGNLINVSSHDDINNINFYLSINEDIFIHNDYFSRIKDIIVNDNDDKEVLFVDKKIRIINNIYLLEFLINEKDSNNYTYYYIFTQNKDIYFIKYNISGEYLASGTELIELIIKNFEWDEYKEIDISLIKYNYFSENGFNISFNYPRNWKVVPYNNRGYYETNNIVFNIPEYNVGKINLNYDVNYTLATCKHYNFSDCIKLFVPEKYDNDNTRKNNLLKKHFYKLNGGVISEIIYYDFETEKYDCYYILPSYKDYHAFHFTIDKSILPSAQSIIYEMVQSITLGGNKEEKYNTKNLNNYPEGLINDFEYKSLFYTQ